MAAVRIEHRADFPEILAITSTADGTRYAVKVTDAKSRRGYDLVNVTYHANGLRSSTSANRSRITPFTAGKIIERYQDALAVPKGAGTRASLKGAQRRSMIPAHWPSRDLGAPADEHESGFQQDARDGHRYFLRAAAKARRGECNAAVHDLATGAQRIGSALAHGRGLRAWPEPTKSLVTTQQRAVDDVARFCKLK